MKSALLKLAVLTLIFLGGGRPNPADTDYGECTIGVFSGRATADGRPMLWKNRDVLGAVQKFCYYRAPVDRDVYYSFIGNCYSDDTTKVYMGLNEVGFAVINSNSYNLGDSLRDGVDDGDLLRMALERCRTLEDLEDLLDLTSQKGRKDCWNIGALDASGHAALYECSNRSYVKFDVDDPEQAPDGIILRATFGLSGTDANRIGTERYKRAVHLVYGRKSDVPLDVRFVLETLARDLSNPIADPYPLPYNGSQNRREPGFIFTDGVSINRSVSRSVMVIRGNRPGEDPLLSTLFCSIGPPVLGVAFPLWVRSGHVPDPLNIGIETPMYSLVKLHRAELYPLLKDPEYLDSHYLVNDLGAGIFSYTLPLERNVIDSADAYVASWGENMPSPHEVDTRQEDLAEYIFEVYSSIPVGKSGGSTPESITLPTVANYPNPFNGRTTIHLTGFDSSRRVNVRIFDLLGREVTTMEISGGQSRFAVWDGRGEGGRPLASGVFLISAESEGRSATAKALLIK